MNNAPRPPGVAVIDPPPLAWWVGCSLVLVGAWSLVFGAGYWLGRAR